MVTSPFTVSSTPCEFPMRTCGANADMAFLRAGLGFCREHALFVWGIVDAEIRAANMSPEEEVAQREAERAEYAARWAAATAREERGGHVYYLRVGPHIKIGFAGDVMQRLRAYPPNSELLALEYGTMKTEKNRHKQFADLLAVGREWFEPAPRLVDHIAEVAKNDQHLNYFDEDWQRRPATSPKAPRHTADDGDATLRKVG